ncbi:hypothetical protein [Tritonibacter horizontis]|uniref:Uncharacterized protein n=1 Tax=Tritonibacter horizontis TaxID=1768241 RepID=A0A132BZY4_9RHOB|nr:hypothetical protein [Tritonibacter horizontis]KUP93340.1 hypothetical protein TRIHO_18370 [Tritonibacter horizontis]
MTIQVSIPQGKRVGTGQRPLATFGFDAFEAQLLAPLRHFLTTSAAPDCQAWHRAFVIAAENWGEAHGLAVAYALWPVVRELRAVRGGDLSYNDPLDLDTRGVLTSDEASLLEMLHHMRRDETWQARDRVEALTLGRMEPELIRAGLSFADRFPCGAKHRLRGTPALHLVG